MAVNFLYLMKNIKAESRKNSMILKWDEDRENYKLHQCILTKINDKKLPDKTGEQRKIFNSSQKKTDQDL